METCDVHKAKRNIRFLQKLDNGTYTCRPDNTCQGARPPPPPQTNVCDLCNESVGDGAMGDHHSTAHSTLIKFCSNLESRATFTGTTTISQSALQRFGEMVRKVGCECDMGEAVFRHVVDAKNQLQHILSPHFPKCTIYVFGSCLSWGCWDGRADIDFTLIDDELQSQRRWPGDDEARLIRIATRSLRDAGFQYDDLEPLVHTRVPIVKHKGSTKIDFDRLKNPWNRTIAYEFNEKLSGEECDDVERQFSNCHKYWEGAKRLIVRFADGAEAIRHFMARHDVILQRKVTVHKRWYRYGYRPTIFSIDFDLSTRAHGIRNSWLLHAYLSQSYIARCGGAFLKQWSKRCGVNHSIKGYITSYATNLLWIYFLISKGHVTFVDPQTISASLGDKGNLRHLDIAPRRPSSDFDEQLGMTVAKFFRFYATEFNWEREVVTVSRPGTTTKEQLGWTQDKEIMAPQFRDRVWYRFAIEDPFEDNLNLARHVSPVKLLKVRAEFLRSYEALVSGSIQRVFKDRSSAAAALTCRTLLHRMMVGREWITVQEAIQQLQDADEEALAAFEVENSTHKLFHLSGYRVVKNGVLEGDIRIPKEAAAAIVEIDDALQLNPFFGVRAAADYLDANLDLIYHHDKRLQRLFQNARDAHRFNEHYDIVERLCKESPDCTAQVIRDHFRDADIDVHDDILKEVLELTKPKKVLPETPAVSKNIHAMRHGTCSECKKRNVEIWPTTAPRIDKGEYCKECWAAYSS